MISASPACLPAFGSISDRAVEHQTESANWHLHCTAHAHFHVRSELQIFAMCSRISNTSPREEEGEKKIKHHRSVSVSNLFFSTNNSYRIWVWPLAVSQAPLIRAADMLCSATGLFAFGARGTWTGGHCNGMALQCMVVFLSSSFEKKTRYLGFHRIYIPLARTNQREMCILFREQRRRFQNPFFFLLFRGEAIDTKLVNARCVGAGIR